MNALVAVELWPLKLFHVEASEVAVVLERADVMQTWPGVFPPRWAADGNVQHEVSLTRRLDYYAQLHIRSPRFTANFYKTRCFSASRFWENCMNVIKFK